MMLMGSACLRIASRHMVKCPGHQPPPPSSCTCWGAVDSPTRTTPACQRERHGVCLLCKTGINRPRGEGAGRAKYSRRNSDVHASCMRAAVVFSIFVRMCVARRGPKNIHTRYEFRAGGQAGATPRPGAAGAQRGAPTPPPAPRPS